MGCEGGESKERWQVEKHRIFDDGPANPNHARNKGAHKSDEKYYDDKRECHNYSPTFRLSFNVKHSRL